MTIMNELFYLNLLEEVMKKGTDRGDRTGTGTRGLFGKQLEFDISTTFPLLSTKRMFFKAIAVELLWFIQGDTNIQYLKDNGVTIWDEWADENGDLGPVYGKQWRNWETPDGRIIDQLKWVRDEIIKNPNSRRLIVSAWNPADVEKQALPPCHCLFQFYVNGDKLSCHLYQRSADMFLGVPFNIASYSLLTMLMARATGLKPDKFVHTFGDVHIYHNHFDQVNEQLKRPIPYAPKLILNPDKFDLFGWQYSDFKLEGYNPLEAIKAPVAV